MPSKQNKRRRKLRLTSGTDQVKPSPIVICLAASVAMLRKAESRNLSLSMKSASKKKS